MADKKGYYEQTDAQFKIRLPHDLKDKIRASADEHNRTMTADIVARLEQSFEPTKPTNIAIHLGNYFSDNLQKMFDEQIEIARTQLKAKYEHTSQDDLDKFLAHLLEQ